MWHTRWWAEVIRQWRKGAEDQDFYMNQSYVVFCILHWAEKVFGDKFQSHN